MSVIDITTFDELKEMSGAEFINELIDTFLEDAPKMIAEIKSALDSNNVDVFRRGAHQSVWVTRTQCLGICPKRGATVAVSEAIGRKF